jgi:ATP/maltotriose-dependent transcriptional regulator MalT
MNEETLPPP